MRMGLLVSEAPPSSDMGQLALGPDGRLVAASRVPGKQFVEPGAGAVVAAQGQMAGVQRGAAAADGHVSGVWPPSQVGPRCLLEFEVEELGVTGRERSHWQRCVLVV